MLKEQGHLQNIFRKSRKEGKEKREEREETEYIQRSRLPVHPDIQNKYDKSKERRVGFDFVRGKNSSVLISGAHGADWIELAGTKGITQEEIDLINQSAKNKKGRYSLLENGCLAIGRQYLNAEQRTVGGYKADTNVAGMCTELWETLSDESGDKKPGVIIYRMPQIYSEPNKVDANNKGSEVVSLEVYEKIGAIKLREYILLKGINNLLAQDIYALRMGGYERLATLESDNAKKEALLECSEIIKKLNRNDTLYKEVIASLGVLKMHREYFEKQEELLYQKGAVERPINLEIHTCFDRLKTEEGIDLVIGTRQCSSVAEAEMEYLLALVLRKEGFNVCLSTLNSFPEVKEENRKKSLEKFIQRGLLSRIFNEQTADAIKKIDKLNTEEELFEKLEEVFRKRLEFIWRRETGQKNILLYLKTEIGDSFEGRGKTKEQLFNLAWSEYKKNLDGLTIEDKRLKVKQESANLAMSQLLDADRLRSGLNGLTSLEVKFGAREKYQTKKGSLPLPAIFQIEIVQSIMKSEEKRKKLQQAFQRFIQLTEKSDFNPRLELNSLIEEPNE